MQLSDQNPFASIEQFRQQFNDGLHRLLNSQQLSTFILVLANATQHKDLFSELEEKLLHQYDAFCQLYKADLAHGNQIDVVDEDFLVYLKIFMLGFEYLKLTQQRTESGWQCQFNHIRSFRPRRISSFHNDNEITAPYDKYTFNFNKRFMRNESFWEGELNGKQIDLFYNKYPFADLHGLCVPERELCLPQLLTEELHHYMWETTAILSKDIPGVGFGYNSYGAYASVNHLHFQMFVDASGLPVEEERWVHNNGAEIYPLDVIKGNKPEESWREIEKLHQHTQPYNLLYREDSIYIFPRKTQGEVEVPIWSSGFTWYELCGSMLMFNHEDYSDITSETIYRQLSKHRLIKC